MGLCVNAFEARSSCKQIIVKMNNFLKSKLFIVVFILFAAVAVGFLSYKTFYFSISENGAHKKSEQVQQAETPNIEASKPEKPAENKKPPVLTQPIFTGFKLYKNVEFGFQIQYPKSWMVSEENIENVRGEQTKGFFFKKPDSDLRFAILPRNGLSYGLSENGTSTPAYIGGSLGVQIKYALKDGRRLWLLHPQYGSYNWSQDIGRLDILSSADDPTGDTVIFEKMLSSFKLSK